MAQTARPHKCRDKWRIRWFDHNGKRQSAVFDKYSDADLALRGKQAEIDRIRAGELAPPPPKKTFNDLADYWEKYRLPLKRSQKDDRSILRRHLRPMFGTTKLADITVAQADEFVRTRAKLSPKTIHNHLTLLIAMLNVAIDLGWLRRKPRIRKPRLTWDDYRYLRTDEEVRKFLEAARAESPVAFAMYCTAVYTGMRAGELCGLQWDNVDVERRLITVQRSYDRPTKTGDIRHVPLDSVILGSNQEQAVAEQRINEVLSDAGYQCDDAAMPRIEMSD
ncbi:MAG: tyrosine-type recombinase/integrase [Deltaproteobacteria bacterium]|nr:tyrosine-type recombinase/integrase [Deltaproteobacteria bacterium]